MHFRAVIAIQWNCDIFAIKRLNFTLIANLQWNSHKRYPMEFSTTNSAIEDQFYEMDNVLFMCWIREWRRMQPLWLHVSKYLLIMSSSLARSVWGKAGSSSSSWGGPSPWPCSSGGLTGEFSLDELGDDV